MTTIRTPPNSPKPPSARPDLRPKMATSKVKQVYRVLHVSRALNKVYPKARDDFTIT